MNLRDFLTSPNPVGSLWELEREGAVADLEPAVASLRMPIPKGYHHKDNLGHSIRVLDNAMEREGEAPDLVLRTAALLHDIGKPATRSFEGKGVVAFRNHETVGARQSKGILTRHGYSPEERAQVGRLISLHMRAYGFGEVQWSDSAVRRLATDAGSQQALDRLIVLFYSDLTTTNERKKRRVESGIARLEEALQRVRELDARRALRPALNGRELMELTGLREGRELGVMMRFLNSDEGVRLERGAALRELKARWPEAFAAKE